MSITWSAVDLSSYSARAAKAVCTTGTEAGPAANDVASGLELRGLSSGGVGVHVESTPDAAFTAGTLDVYLYNPATGNWNLAPDLQITVPAGSHRFAAAGLPVSAGVGRIAVVPTGLGQPCEVHVNAAAR